MSGAPRPEEEDEEEDEDYIPEDDQPQTAEEKEVIARRTRAQHSLKETAWEELERWLNEQQPSPSPPGTPAESRSLYADFLARLRDPGPALDDGAETDPGEEDFDFVPQEDAEKKQYDVIYVLSLMMQGRRHAFGWRVHPEGRTRCIVWHRAE